MFLVHSLQSVQSLDNKLSSHAIVQDVSHPDQITEIFDRISYDKVCLIMYLYINKNKYT